MQGLRERIKRPRPLRRRR